MGNQKGLEFKGRRKVATALLNVPSSSEGCAIGRVLFFYKKKDRGKSWSKSGKGKGIKGAGGL